MEVASKLMFLALFPSTMLARLSRPKRVRVRERGSLSCTVPTDAYCRLTSLGKGKRQCKLRLALARHVPKRMSILRNSFSRRPCIEVQLPA